MVVRPASASVVRAARPASGIHVVRPRDTVSGIAKRYGVSTRDVLRWNRLDEPHRIRPGDRLRVTDFRSTGERARAR
jgi:LysM repeat protein